MQENVEVEVLLGVQSLLSFRCYVNFFYVTKVKTKATFLKLCIELFAVSVFYLVVRMFSQK